MHKIGLSNHPDKLAVRSSEEEMLERFCFLWLAWKKNEAELERSDDARMGNNKRKQKKKVQARLESIRSEESLKPPGSLSNERDEGRQTRGS